MAFCGFLGTFPIDLMYKSVMNHLWFALESYGLSVEVINELIFLKGCGCFSPNIPDLCPAMGTAKVLHFHFASFNL